MQQRGPIPSAAAATRSGVLADAWRSVRRNGLVAPELPAILFVAVASAAGFGWGLTVGLAMLAAITCTRVYRRLPLRTIVSGKTVYTASQAK